jgi:hypothetical protein
MKRSASSPRAPRGLFRATLRLFAALGVAGFLVWRWPTTEARSTRPAVSDALVVAFGESKPISRGSAPASAMETRETAEFSPGLRARVLALTRAYENRREADDPAGADVERLRFLELLDDENASRFVRGLSPEFLETFFGDLALRRWAGHDRAAAAAWMAAHPVAHPVPAAALAHEWVTRDAAGLHAYLDALPAGDWKHLVAKSAAEEALVADRPEAALALMDKIVGPDARRDELHEWAATKWALTEPADAAAWAESVALAKPELGERLFAAVAVGQANRDPETAIRWLMETTRNPATQAPAVEAISRMWTARDPEAAARWAEGLPAGPLREAAEGGLLAVVESGRR